MLCLACSNEKTKPKKKRVRAINETGKEAYFVTQRCYETTGK
jgi:hypothetical protein